MRLLGTITIPAGVARANKAISGGATATAVPFSLPKNPCSLVLMPSATGLTARLPGLTADAADLPLLTANWTMPFAGGESRTLNIFNNTGGSLTVKVFASDGPGFVLNLL